MTRRKSQSKVNRIRRAARAASKSRTHVFDITGIQVRQLQKTRLGRRIVELSRRNLPEDIALVEDELLNRFREGRS